MNTFHECLQCDLSAENLLRKTLCCELFAANLCTCLVGVERFELPTSCSQSRRATRLRYTPMRAIIIPAHANGEEALAIFMNCFNWSCNFAIKTLECAALLVLFYDLMVGVAQLVEPRIVIPVVVGSSPIVHPSHN